MNKIQSVDLSTQTLSIDKQQTVSIQQVTDGPPVTTDGINIGLATMEQSPPHNGERHNDGDEIIIVLSGKVSVTSDSNSDSQLVMVAGDTCIIRKGEWHKVNVIEKAQIIYVTPGANNQHRF